MKRIGVLGGTFDPVHRGHLFAARYARRQLPLDEVLFVPCYAPPHRGGKPAHSSPWDRYAMTALAVDEHERVVRGQATQLRIADKCGTIGDRLAADVI